MTISRGADPEFVRRHRVSLLLSRARQAKACALTVRAQSGLVPAVTADIGMAIGKITFGRSLTCPPNALRQRSCEKIADYRNFAGQLLCRLKQSRFLPSRHFSEHNPPRNVSNTTDSQLALDRALTTLCGLRDFATLFADRSDSSEFCWSENRVFC